MSLSIYPVMHSGFTDGEDCFYLWYFPIREKSFMTGYMLRLASVLPVREKSLLKGYTFPCLWFFFFRRLSDLMIPSKGSVTATVVRSLHE